MKKIISLLLVLVMVFSMTVFASAAGSSFTDIYNSKNEDAIEFLYDLGLVEGYSVTKFGPKKNLTRAEACALIVRALIEDDEIYASAKDNFVDVDDYAWYREWVDTAYRNHIMHGYGNGVFGPEDHVTYVQYATILVNALGYDSLNFEGTWPANVEELAVKLDLYDNVSVHVSDDEITREDAAQMLYNALWCKMVGMRGVTLYDVVTAEKYSTYFTTIQILDVDEYGWVKFMEETGNIQVVHKTSVNTGTHEIVVGHYEKVWITYNADYSKVYSVKYFECAESVVVAPTYVTGIIEEIYRNDDDTINYIVIDGKDKHYFADEYTVDNVDNIGFAVGVECEVTIVNNKVIHIRFWEPKVEQSNGLIITSPSEADYVVNTSTKIFHKYPCSHISKIAPNNMKNVDNHYLSLISLGYLPCSDCLGSILDTPNTPTEETVTITVYAYSKNSGIKAIYEANDCEKVYIRDLAKLLKVDAEWTKAYITNTSGGHGTITNNGNEYDGAPEFIKRYWAHYLAIPECGDATVVIEF